MTDLYDKGTKAHKKGHRTCKTERKTFVFTFCCTSSGIFNIEDGFPWMICLTKDRREGERKKG